MHAPQQHGGTLPRAAAPSLRRVRQTAVVDYTAAVDAFFQDRPDAPVPAAVTGAQPARRLRDAGEPIAMHGVWSRAVNEAMAERGLNFLSSYVWGRAASLGEPSPAVVAAAFAWFEPGLASGLYDEGRKAVPYPAMTTAYDAAITDSLRAVLGDDPEIGPTADLLIAAAEPAQAIGRPLFAGLRAHGRPDDPHLRLWWACELVREHRGDSHLAAANAVGVGPVEMNILTELWIGMPLLSYTATRGWSPEAMEQAVQGLRQGGLLEGEALTDAGRRLREQVEEATNVQEADIVTRLGADLDPTCERLQDWSQRCVQAGAFPPDPLKRAAG